MDTGSANSTKTPGEEERENHTELSEELNTQEAQ